MELQKLKMIFFGQKCGKVCQKSNHTHVETANAWKQR